MNGTEVRTRRTPARTWRMRAWPGDPTVAHLIFVDHGTVPSADDLTEAIDQATRRGARAVRTSAMFPDTAAVAGGHGFTPIDRLALLGRTLDELPTRTHGDPRSRPRPMQAWHFGACARIDREAFGATWGNSRASLRDIRQATPAYRARVVGARRRPIGFALSGAAADTGYLQRLAVSPAHQRRGVATVLVADSLGWMRERGLRSAMVNTGVDNVAALALYASFGFRTLGDELTIAELRLT